MNIEHLDEARAALAADDFATALEALVAEWQRTRSPAIADLIDAVDLRVRVPGEAPASEEDWARQCLLRSPRLLRGLLHGFLKGRSPACTRRMALLRETNDPRLSRVLIDVIRTPPFRNDTTRPFWKLLFETLSSLQDVRIIEELRALERSYDQIMSNDTAPFIRARARDTIVALTRVSTTTPDFKLVDALREALRGALDDVARSQVKPDFEPLYAAVWKAPHDDSPRAVLADALTEAGDPRGAFITEQLASRQERQLDSNAFVDTLLGPLSTAVVHPTFERGFPVSAPLFIKKKKWVEDAVGLPNWATFKRLVMVNRPLPDAWQEPVLALLTSSAFKSLEAFSVRADVPSWLDPALERVHTLEVFDASNANRVRFKRWQAAKPGRTLTFSKT